MRLPPRPLSEHAGNLSLSFSIMLKITDRTFGGEGRRKQNNAFMLSGVKDIKNSQGSKWKLLEQFQTQSYPCTHSVSWGLVNNIYSVVCKMLLETLEKV